jgi:hypothetical protein
MINEIFLIKAKVMEELIQTDKNKFDEHKKQLFKTMEHCCLFHFKPNNVIYLSMNSNTNYLEFADEFARSNQAKNVVWKNSLSFPTSQNISS